jgi:prepilin-type N-terminal cleavage/methylation domain-containing protein
MKTKLNNKGFTLVELLLVIAIIAILASVLFVSLGKQRERARKTTFKENTRGLVTTFTACTDSGANINVGTTDEDMNQQAACDAGSFGKLPKVAECDGTAATYAQIKAPVESGDSWYFVGTCTNSDTTQCFANCNSDGCIFCNDELTFDAATGQWDDCASGSTNCD